MGCFSPDMPAPVNYGQQTRDTLQAQVDLAPQLYQSEATYQPKYADLASNNLNTVSRSAANTYSDLLPGLTTAQSNANTTLRTRDIADVNNLAGAGRQALRTANPDSAALLDKLNRSAGEGLDAGSMLTADQQRGVNNAVRGSQGARGVAYGPASAYSEVLSNSQYGDQLKQQREGTAAGVIGQNQNFYGDPYAQILGRSSGAGGAAAGAIGAAQNQKAGAQIFNPESPLSASITAGNQQMAGLFSTSTAQEASNAWAPTGSGY